VPVYEYECPECKKTFELEQKISEPARTECIEKHCDGKVRRLIAGSSFVLKGSGWFRDGY
jgi:putative FmdB family regulatory protein